MVHVARTFPVDAPVEAVVAYLADFSNAVAWDPGTVRCTRIGTGPVEVGATWANVSKVLGRETELTYELRVLEPGHVQLRGTNKTATSIDDITVRPHARGAEVTYDASVTFNGLAKLGWPVMQLEFLRLGKLTVEGITRETAKL